MSDLEKAVRLHNRRLTMDCIAAFLGCDRATVRDLLNRAPIEWIREPESMPVRQNVL